jgi:hypothetical protein
VIDLLTAEREVQRAGSVSDGIGATYSVAYASGSFAEPSRRLRWLTFGILAVGLVWRIHRYLLQFPIWGDEAMLALNFLRLDYHGLTQRLENCQIAPVLFLWGEFTACNWLGTSELSLRLLPFLAGVASLGLFYLLARHLLNPLASGLAVGFLAVANWPVSMSAFIKPYSFDLLWSLALLVPAVQWLKNPSKTWLLMVLVLLAPLALLGSYPTAFVAGAVSVALVWRIYQDRTSVNVTTIFLFLTFNLAVVASFGLALWIGRQQLSTPINGVNTAMGMEQYWADGFPPNSLLNLPAWLLLATTGQMTAYPIGSANGGSTLTVLLCLVGAWQWAKSRQCTWLILCTNPFFFGLVAAFMHRYPYGAAGRLSQHLAPLICIMAGLGAATIIERPTWSTARRWKWSCAAFALLALIGVGGMIRDTIRPYHDLSAPWTRDVMTEILARVPANDKVVICNGKDDVGALFNWYWTLQGERVYWNGAVPEQSRDESDGVLWGFSYGDGGSDACTSLNSKLAAVDPRWRLAERIPFTLEPVSRHDPREHCELFRFIRESTVARPPLER